MSMTVNTSCRICRSTNLVKVIDLGSQPLANAFLRTRDDIDGEEKYPLEVYVCEDCHLAQLIHVVDKETLFSDYIYFSSGMPKLSNHFHKYAEDIIARFLSDNNDLVVEIGSNDGILLQFFKDKGFRVLGVDPAKNIAPVAEARGVPTIADFFSLRIADQIMAQHGQAKTIMGNNVVAHINDYEDLGRAVKKLLAPDGVFVFEAPYLVDMFQNLAFDTIYHEHLNFLAIRPLLHLFKRWGLEIFDVLIVPAQGQSIRVFVGHRGAHPIHERVNGCILQEIDTGLHEIASYRRLADRIDTARQKVTAILQEFRAEGKRIAAYGAPAKGNTVLNYYGIGEETLDFAMDELPSKQGFLTPGTHVPVIDRATAQKNEPNAYLLLAWNYLSVILDKEKEFLDRGGIFVLPNGATISRPIETNTVGELVATGAFRKKILICGGAGFIGSNFVRHVYEKYTEYQIYNLDLLTYSGNRENLADVEKEEGGVPEHDRRYIFLQGDICNRDFLRRLFVIHQFDMVINFAAESHVDRSLTSSFDFIRTNVMGVHTLIDLCREHKVSRFLQISTDEVYGDVLEGASTEHAPLNPSNPYSASKAAADVLIKSYMRSHKLPAVIIRGSNNVGPFQYPEKLIPLAISNFLEGKKIPVHGTGEHIRSWIHVRDFCEAIDLVLHEGQNHHIYNASGTQRSNLDVLTAIHRALRVPGPIDQHKVHTNDRPGADLRYAPDAGKIKYELGWRPRYDFDRMIEETVAWYLENQDWWRRIKSDHAFIEHYKRQQEANYY